MPVYLVFLIIFFVMPVFLIGWLLRNRLRKLKRTIFWCLFFTFTLGFFWDWLAVQTGVWRYDSAQTLGIWLWGLSIEEIVGFYVFGTLLLVGVPLLLIARNEDV